jgi:hypothetical protein
MTAYNAVRMRVKPGLEGDFIAAHRAIKEKFPGARKVSVVKTGDRSFCIIGEWSGMTALANARPKMVGLLDSFRHMLEELGDGQGLTDPVSGEAVVERSFAKAKPAAKRMAGKSKPAAKKSAARPGKKAAKARSRSR